MNPSHMVPKIISSVGQIRAQWASESLGVKMDRDNMSATIGISSKRPGATFPKTGKGRLSDTPSVGGPWRKWALCNVLWDSTASLCSAVTRSVLAGCLGLHVLV